MAASEVASFKTNFVRIADTSEAETWVSGKAECVHAIGKEKNRKLLSSALYMYVTRQVGHATFNITMSFFLKLAFQVLSYLWALFLKCLLSMTVTLLYIKYILSTSADDFLFCCVV